MVKYKLTDENMCTYNNCKWEIGVKKTVSGEGELCSDGWLHCYDSPELAVLLNPIHADFKNPKLFEVEVSGQCKTDKGIKCGFTEMTLIREIDLPVFTLEQRVKFGILCAKQVCKNVTWDVWADKWLSGKNRTKKDADAAAYTTSYAAAAAAAAASCYAADIAAYAAAVTADYGINLVEIAKSL